LGKPWSRGFDLERLRVGRIRGCGARLDPETGAKDEAPEHCNPEEARGKRTRRTGR
jgi:hypothetical protein